MLAMALISLQNYGFGTKCDLDLLLCKSNVGQKKTNVLKLLYFTINWSLGVSYELHHNRHNDIKCL